MKKSKIKKAVLQLHKDRKTVMPVGKKLRNFITRGKSHGHKLT